MRIRYVGAIYRIIMGQDDRRGRIVDRGRAVEVFRGAVPSIDTLFIHLQE